MRNKIPTPTVPLPAPANAPADFIQAIWTWTAGKLSARSGFYAGRGPNPSDLGSRHLELLYQGILKDFSAEHAKRFVQFVEALTDLSASAFLVAFERFFGTGCSDPKCYAQQPGDFAALSGRGLGLENEAYGAVVSALSDKRDSVLKQRISDSIKYSFLREHGVKPPKQMDNNGYSYVYFNDPNYP